MILRFDKAEQRYAPLVMLLPYIKGQQTVTTAELIKYMRQYQKCKLALLGYILLFSYIFLVSQTFHLEGSTML